MITQTQFTESDIDKKIDELPTISFDDNEEFQRVVMSQDFTDIFNYIMQTRDIPDKIRALNEIDQRISLYLTLTSQDENFITQSDRILYARHFPDIEEFLDNNFYMGYTSGGIYPYWREKMLEMFDKGSTIKKAVFTGCIGSGKSTIARKCSIYSLYKVLCLRHPRAVFNVDNDATLASFIYSITLKTVYETNLMPFVKILDSMPCFQRVQKISAFKNFDITDETSSIPYCVTGSGGDTTIHFANNVIQFAGSQETHQTGRNIFNAFLDEVSEKGLEDGLRIINALDARIASRFQGSNFTFFSIVSSAKEKASPIGAYIRSIPSDDKETIVFSPKLWEVKPDPDFQGDGRTFTVLVGNGIIPSRIIDNELELEQIKNGEFVLQNGCEIIEPPLFYKQKFEMNIDQAIQDIAGIATGGEDLVFRDTSKLQDTNLCPEVHFVADLGKKTDLFQFLPPHLFTIDLNGKKRFKRAPNAERVIHLDLAEASGETEAGIGLMHKELYKAPNSVFPEEMYVVDFIGYVNSKTRIDLEAIQNLYIKLVTEYGCNIRLMSSDQHQGELMRQFFDNHRLATETAYISVDRTLQPYNNAARLIELGRVKVGKCPYLIEQMENVGIRSGKAVRLNTTRKDMTDVLCGMIEGARICNLSAAYTYSTSSQEKENKDHIQSLLKTDQFLVDI